MHNAYVLLLLIVDIITSREAIFFFKPLFRWDTFT